ncbi:LLM class flavin-dependent oxidoreductase [Nocardioides nematodiphilus]|uniref:LLM class flavin-dependent oxidoreductase n=1 Tax=Nocardioides nematodiphilus TaxID=2849669 RepID=UPI001CD92A39|nr:LLM class flavin-dependent oxidoreductase [Nocardioides nematodiphilus]MCA1983117.1 LLM class flavin-dependent oxidoreductase [Nocardioides nematodiphilus]
MSRQLHLNAFLMEAGHHEAAWRLPEADPGASFDLGHYVRLAQLAEAATFDSLFLADGPVAQGTGEFRTPGQLEPLTLLTALAGVTERIGLIATASTTYNDPYNLARKFASVDHVSGGRAGWNIVTSATEQEAANFGLADRPAHSARYERAEEFLQVALKLWDSWSDDHFLGDKAGGRWGDPAELRAIDHVGKHFRVAGPLNVPRPPQGYPLLVQAGASEEGKAFAGTYAEAIFVAHQTLELAQAFYSDIKARAAAAGRNPDHVVVLPGIVPIIGSTEREAIALAQQLDDLRIPAFGLRMLAGVLEVPESQLELDAPLSPAITGRTSREGFDSRANLIIELAVRENLTVRQILGRLGGGRGHNVVVGTPEQIVEVIECWFHHGGADGFNVMGAALPSGLETFIEQVVPILRAKGLFREEYAGTTLREHYGLPKPANQYARVGAAAAG